MDLKVLKLVRQSRKLTLIDLSKRTGINADRIGLIERGKVNPSFETVVDIVKALDLELRICFKE